MLTDLNIACKKQRQSSSRLPLKDEDEEAELLEPSSVTREEGVLGEVSTIKQTPAEPPPRAKETPGEAWNKNTDRGIKTNPPVYYTRKRRGAQRMVMSSTGPAATDQQPSPQGGIQRHAQTTLSPELHHRDPGDLVTRTTTGAERTIDTPRGEHTSVATEETSNHITTARPPNPQPPSAPAPIRTSTRLAAKPRRVHSLPSHRGPRANRQTDGQRNRHATETDTQSSIKPNASAGPVAMGTVSMETLGADEVCSIAGETLAGQPEMFDVVARERRYQCSSCGKRFYQLCHLKKHQFTHMDTKPFCCEICGKTYASVENYKSHQV